MPPPSLTAALAALGLSTTAASIDLPKSAPLPPLCDVVIEGENHTPSPALVVLRADDAPGEDYAHRVDAERMVQAGHFSLRLRLAALTTPRGRALDTQHLLLVRAFSDQPGVALTALRTEAAAALPQGTRAWFFGPAAEAPLSGMTSITPTDPAVSGPALRQVHRASADPVMAWGIRLTRFNATLPPGRWHLTLWTEDPGEWETLPQVLGRRVRLNGADILMERRTPAEWVAGRYLAGRTREASPGMSPYDTLAAPRGGRIAADVMLPDGRFTLELAGDPQAAQHVSLITASPAAMPDAAEHAVDTVRRTRFAESWPVLQGPPAPSPATALALDGAPTATTAPGGMAIFHLQAVTPRDVQATAETEQAGLPTTLFWGMWRWQRPAPDVPGLVFTAQHLRGDAALIPLRADLPRPLVLIARVPAGTRPGTYHLAVSLHAGTTAARHALTLTVLPVSRPAPAATIGPFLDFAPHLADDPAGARLQSACDMRFLSGLGLTSVAPALTPPSDDPAGFIADLRAAEAVFPGAPIAYAPARHMLWTLGAKHAADVLANANQAARAAGLRPPLWSTADEPSAAGTLDDAQAFSRAIHVADRDARLVGHLNDPADSRILQDLNVVTLNPRFGVDPAVITTMRARGITPYLYNMPHQRLAAGFYLWRSGAAGLLQWHARMPTADAFDPTDGREGDVQFIWPTKDVCGPPDIDAQLLELAEGAEDARWIAWLAAGADAGNPRAALLRASLRAALGDGWQTASHLPETAPAAMRDAIIALARGLNM